MFTTMLAAEGLKSGVVYASGIMKAFEVMRMAADFRAQESISKMTQRILKENNVPVNEEIAIAVNDDYFNIEQIGTDDIFSIPLMSTDDKGVLMNAT